VTSRTIRLSSNPRTFRTSQDPTKSPQGHLTFLPDSSPCKPASSSSTRPTFVTRLQSPRPMVSPNMRYQLSPSPPAQTTSYAGIEELSDSQWAASGSQGLGSSQTDINQLEEEARNIIGGEERRIAMKLKNDPRRENLGELVVCYPPTNHTPSWLATFVVHRLQPHFRVIRRVC